MLIPSIHKAVALILTASIGSLLLPSMMGGEGGVAMAMGTIEGSPFVDLSLAWGYDETPDCVKRSPLILVNGEWPPPVIRVKAGEQVTMEVHNELVSVAFTIHLHGFDQEGTPWADGTGMITTCPIIPDTDSSVQKFMAPTTPGTFLYHGHVAQAKVAGFTGLLLVDANPDQDIDWPEPWGDFEADLPLLLSDSYHAPALPAITGLLQRTFRWPGDPQTILLNGVGHFNCSDNHVYTCNNFESDLCSAADQGVCGAGQRSYYNNLVQCDLTTCPPRAKLNVESAADGEDSKTYLLRIGNGSVLSMLNVAIENHTMTVVELDGIPTQPSPVTSLDLHSGQRASVLVTADQPPGLYWISVMVRGRGNVVKGAGLLAYDGLADATLEGSEGDEHPDLVALQASQPAWNDWEFMKTQQKQFTSWDITTMPEKDSVTQTFVLLNTQERYLPGEVDNTPQGGDSTGLGIGDVLEETPQCKCDQEEDGVLKWGVARKTFVNPKTPILHNMYFGLEDRTPEQLESEGFYMVEEGGVYDIVLQNYPACNGVCEVHPWHMHGHHFWHVGTFDGAYDPEVGYPEEETGGFYYRDTINVIGAESRTETCEAGAAIREPCGYTVIRFVADNPGAWLFHCHVDWHMVMGMSVVFYYKDLATKTPEPNLEHVEMCGKVYPNVLVDRALGSNNNPDSSAATPVAIQATLGVSLLTIMVVMTLSLLG